MTDEHEKIETYAMENYIYLGDGAYAFFDGFGVWLRTDHHLESHCDQQIYLEPNMLDKLTDFVNSLKEKKHD